MHVTALSWVPPPQLTEQVPKLAGLFHENEGQGVVLQVCCVDGRLLVQNESATTELPAGSRHVTVRVWVPLHEAEQAVQALLYQVQAWVLQACWVGGAAAPLQLPAEVAAPVLSTHWLARV